MDELDPLWSSSLVLCWTLHQQVSDLQSEHRTLQEQHLEQRGEHTASINAALFISVFMLPIETGFVWFENHWCKRKERIDRESMSMWGREGGTEGGAKWEEEKERDRALTADEDTELKEAACTWSGNFLSSVSTTDFILLQRIRWKHDRIYTFIKTEHVGQLVIYF